jgi:hypothetical protein
MFERRLPEHLQIKVVGRPVLFIKVPTAVQMIPSQHDLAVGRIDDHQHGPGLRAAFRQQSKVIRSISSLTDGAIASPVVSVQTRTESRSTAGCDFRRVKLMLEPRRK